MRVVGDIPSWIDEQLGNRLTDRHNPKLPDLLNAVSAVYDGLEEEMCSLETQADAQFSSLATFCSNLLSDTTEAHQTLTSDDTPPPSERRPLSIMTLEKDATEAIKLMDAALKPCAAATSDKNLEALASTDSGLRLLKQTERTLRNVRDWDVKVREVERWLTRTADEMPNDNFLDKLDLDTFKSHIVELGGLKESVLTVENIFASSTRRQTVVRLLNRFRTLLHSLLRQLGPRVCALSEADAHQGSRLSMQLSNVLDGFVVASGPSGMTEAVTTLTRTMCATWFLPKWKALWTAHCPDNVDIPVCLAEYEPNVKKYSPPSEQEEPGPWALCLARAVNDLRDQLVLVRVKNGAR